jgi:hypothetical protein|tara:strand:+ start:924 stop:1355 length:432 start_codon:yes stop_codon:yes gene_type:complete
MNNRGALNIASLFGMGLLLILVIAGVGYLIGSGAATYNVSVNTTIGGNDLTSQEFLGLEYFTNATQNAEQDFNLTNTTQSDAGGISFIDSLSGTKLLLADMVQLTPLGGTAFGNLIDDLIVAFFAGIIFILGFQLVFGRTLTS